MSKRIIVCLDGTGNEVKARGVTNVFKIAELAELDDPDHPQVLYYGPGVGTVSAPGAWTQAAQWVSKFIGGQALGHGMRRDIGNAYAYLMNTWQPGDTVFVIGFSRGAYTARALCGMLYRVGLLRPGSENLIPYAVRVYARRAGDDDLAVPEGWDRMDRFAEALSIRHDDGRLSFPIHFLGLFDTVKGTGIIGPDLHWPYTNLLPNVAVVRHAVAIDEWRRPFRESLITVHPPGEKPAVTEVWFAGIHSDIGGGYFADPKHHDAPATTKHLGSSADINDPQLGNISMRWMLDGAIAEGLRVRKQAYRNRYTLSEIVERPMHANSFAWRLAGFRHRRIPEGARVHASVYTRMAADPHYRPRLPENYTREDEHCWEEPTFPDQ